MHLKPNQPWESLLTFHYIASFSLEFVEIFLSLHEFPLRISKSGIFLSMTVFEMIMKAYLRSSGGPADATARACACVYNCMVPRRRTVTVWG